MNNELKVRQLLPAALDTLRRDLSEAIARFSEALGLSREKAMDDLLKTGVATLVDAIGRGVLHGLTREVGDVVQRSN
jgi:hypothetical protein